MYYILILIGLALLVTGIIGLYMDKDSRKGESRIATENSSATTDKSNEKPAQEENANNRYADDGLTEAERKGQAFEMFVRDHFSHNEYSLVEHVNDKASHEHVTERSKYPDMVFRHVPTDTKFAVECKYRSKWEINGKTEQIEWAEEHNIKNYLYFANEQKIDVVVIIGVGGSPDNPAEVYAAPLNALKKYTIARKNYLQQFKLTNTKSNFRFILSKHTVEN